MQIQNSKVLNRRNILLFALGMIFVCSFIPVLNLSFPSYATASIVQHTFNDCVGGGCGADPPQTVSATFGSPVTKGNVLVVVGEVTCEDCGTGVAFTAINDSLGNAWNGAVSVFYSHTSISAGLDNSNTAIFYAQTNQTGSDTIQLHVQTTASGNALYIQIYELSGVALSFLTSTGRGFNTFSTVNAYNASGITIAGSGTDATGVGSSWSAPANFALNGGYFSSAQQQGIGAYSSNETALTTIPLEYGAQEGIWTEAAISFTTGGGGGCSSCVVTTGTITFTTTSCTTISNVTYCGTVTGTSTFTSTIGSTFVTTITSFTSVTTTNTVFNAPNTDSFAFWGIPLMFNFILAFSFLVPAMALKANSSFLYALLFFTGLLFGGIIGLMAHITPWYDPVLCGLVLAAVIVFRAL